MWRTGCTVVPACGRLTRSRSNSPERCPNPAATHERQSRDGVAVWPVGRSLPVAASEPCHIGLGMLRCTQLPQDRPAARIARKKVLLQFQISVLSVPGDSFASNCCQTDTYSRDSFVREDYQIDTYSRTRRA